MKTSDAQTLNMILKHKEHFDKKLLDIATTSDNKIKALQNELVVIKMQKNNMSNDLRRTKQQLESKDKELHNVRTILSKRDEELEKAFEILKEIEESIKEKNHIIEEMEEKLRNYEKKQERLEKEIKKLRFSNSTNSNMGSSFDVLSHTKAKANANTRTKSSLKRGGQKGHALHKSSLMDNPNVIINKNVDKAPLGAVPFVCGNEIKYYATQEIDLSLNAKITETRYYLKENGEKLSEEIFKKYAINPITYSSHFKASIVYLNQKGTIPLQRLSDIINEISYGKIDLKPSTISSWAKEVHERSENERNQILENILKEKVTHVDETGIKINGSLYWAHTLTNASGSYFLLTEKRGDAENGPLAHLIDYEGYLVRDHFKAYQRLKKCTHVECNAHIDRYLKSGIDIDKSEECQEMLDLLHEMLSRKTKLISKGIEKMNEKEIKKYEARYLEIANRGLRKYKEKTKNVKRFMNLIIFLHSEE